jgi:hypothetical protein
MQLQPLDFDSKCIKLEIKEDDDKIELVRIKSNFDSYKIENYAKFEGLKSKIARNQRNIMILILVLFILFLACLGCLVYLLFFNQNK